MTEAATQSRPHMSTFRQILLSFYWFSTNLMWAAILIISMPSQIKAAVGNDAKGSALGLALGAGAFISMLAAPIFGALSDRIRLPGGRRKPWIVIGTLGTIVSLVGLAFLAEPGHPESLIPWSVAFVFWELFSNIATAPFSALIPDLVSKEQRGSASGWLGLMTMLGTFAGGLTGFMVAPLGIASVYYVMMVAMAIGLVVTLFGVNEPELPRDIQPFEMREFLVSLAHPFRNADFTWVLLTRLLVTMGIFTVQEFIQYYMADVIGAPYVLLGRQVADTAESAVSFFLPALLLGAIITTLLAGVLSDRYGRKPLVYLSGALMGLVCLVFVLFHSFTLAVLMGIVFGLGYGAYESVDWALVSDVLPSVDDYAKDMGVWHVRAMVLPQVIATPVAGFMLDNFQRIGAAQNMPNLGYTVIFMLAVLYFILGTVFVRQIKAVR